MPATYIQIFSMTDHAQPLNGRFQGPYVGVNAEVQTSEFSDGTIKISEATKAQHGNLDRSVIEKSKVLLAYRHSDTGILNGTSESLIPVSQLPWTDMPGIEVQKANPKGSVQMKLWMQEMKLQPGQVTRVHFGKTIVYLKNWGKAEAIEWTDQKLTSGPSQLHAEPIDQDLTISAASGSALVVKMGQETEKSS